MIRKRMSIAKFEYFVRDLSSLVWKLQLIFYFRCGIKRG